MKSKDKILNFEAAIEELEAVTKALEAGDVSLEALLEKYKRGVLLSDYCLRQLDETKTAMDELLIETNGEIKTAALQLEEEVKRV